MNRIPFVRTPCYWKRIFLDIKHTAIRDGTWFNSAKKSIRGLTQVRSDPSLYLCSVPSFSTEPREPAPSPLSHFVPVAVSPFSTPLTQALSALALRSSVNVLPSFPPSHTPYWGLSPRSPGIPPFRDQKILLQHKFGYIVSLPVASQCLQH